MDIDDVTPTSSLAANSPDENSALILLFKKLATTTSNLFDGVLDSLPREESPADDDDGGIMEELFGMYDEEFDAAGLLSDVFLPYLSPLLNALLPEGELARNQSSKPRQEGRAGLPAPKAAAASTETAREQNPKKDGLVPPTLDVVDRLDYVIAQMDISRTERRASRRLDADVRDSPAVVHGDDLICPPCREGEDTRPEPEGCFENAQWSWMVVPRDSNEDVERIPERGGIPESISICSSKPGEFHERMMEFEYCVICGERFREGECLRVLPCEHLFHSTCICSSKVLEETISGCPMCKNNETTAAPLSSFHSDGSVPSWAFVKLGSLLSSKESKDKGLHHHW